MKKARIVLPALLIGTLGFALVETYRSYEERRTDEAIRKEGAARAAKIKRFQEEFSALSQPSEVKKVPDINWPACAAGRGWGKLLAFSQELADAGWNPGIINRQDEFAGLRYDRAMELASAVAYGNGALECGDPKGSHVFLVEEAIGAADERAIYLGGHEAILSALRMALIRELKPFVREALDYFRNGGRGSPRPDFFWLGREIYNNHLSAKELGINGLQHTAIIMASNL